MEIRPVTASVIHEGGPAGGKTEISRFVLQRERASKTTAILSTVLHGFEY